jgi:hypothetical protein
MELELVPVVDDAMLAAVHLAAAAADATGETGPGRGLWWRAGVEEAIATRSLTPSAGQGYEAAPSPRRTRGATRA